MTKYVEFNSDIELNEETSDSFYIETIEWDDLEANITEHFKVKEALYLPKLGIYYSNLTDDEKFNIYDTAVVLENIRSLFDNQTITVTSWIRPVVEHDGQLVDYNALIGGSSKSAHKNGMAVDFVVSGLSCEYVRRTLVNELEDLDIRMEDHDGNWVHVDTKEPIFKRFFKP